MNYKTYVVMVAPDYRRLNENNRSALHGTRSRYAITERGSDQMSRRVRSVGGWVGGAESGVDGVFEMCVCSLLRGIMGKNRI